MFWHPRNNSPAYSVRNASLYSVLETDDWSISQPSLCLVDVVVPRHAAISHLLAGQIRLSKSKCPKDPLKAGGDEEAKVLGQDPDILGLSLVARGFPGHARKVEKVNGRVVGDQECLTVDLFDIEHCCLTLVLSVQRGKQGGCRQVVSMCDVCDFGKVKQIRVVAELEAGLASVVGGEALWQELHIALAKDCGWSDGARYEFWVAGRTIRCKHVHFGEPLALLDARVE